MQKAIGRTNAPHVELEAKLQQEYARIVPKVERGVDTKAKADHLHSLETRGQGHAERGGLTAIAQSMASRHEKKPSASSSGGNARSRANSRTLTPHKQSHCDVDFDTPGTEAENRRAQSVAAAIKALRPSEQRSPEKGGVRPSCASSKHLQSLSESTNTTRGGDSIYDVAFPKLQSYGSADMGSGGYENVPRAHKRENSLPAI